MNAYCTYFDRGFLPQGLALWRSLARHDPDAVLWVLALDEFTEALLRELGEPRLRVVALAELEAGDPELRAAKANRTPVEYTFTLSPCWPRWLLARQPGIDRVTYLDADLFFFGAPAPVFAAMDAARASVLITGHRFPSWLRHYEQHGRFNVGLLSFRRDAAGLACLDDWRARCLEWCHDRVEGDRYADQKYLDAWPARLGAALLVLDRPGVNLAPWNWANEEFVARAWVDDGRRSRVSVALPRCETGSRAQGRDAPATAGQRRRGDAPGDGGLVVFHFARFRPLRGDWWWQSGQLDYGVMPWRRRQAIYGPYWRALAAARAEIAARRPGFDFPRRAARGGRDFWRALPLRLVFGGNWLRVGDRFFNLRLGLGRWSGRALAAARRAVRGAGGG